MRTSRRPRTVRFSDPRARAIASAHCLQPEDLAAVTRTSRVQAKSDIVRRQLQQMLASHAMPLSPCATGHRLAYETVAVELAAPPKMEAPSRCAPAPPCGRGASLLDDVLDTPKGAWPAPGGAGASGLPTNGGRRRFLSSRARGATDAPPRRTPAGLRRRGGTPGAREVTQTEIDHYSRYSIALPASSGRGATAPARARLGGSGRTDAAAPRTTGAHFQGSYGPDLKPHSTVGARRADFACSGPSAKLLSVSPLRTRPSCTVDRKSLW